MMPVSNARRRVVVFRLSQDEYDCLKRACFDKGARNLSDFTRSELLAVIRSGPPEGVMYRRLSELERRLAEVQSSVEQIVQLLIAPEAAQPATARLAEG